MCMVGLLRFVLTCDYKLQFSTADWPLKRGRLFMQLWSLAALAGWPLVRGRLY